MKTRSRLLAVLALLLLAACDDMHDQPSFRPQEAPRLTPAAGAVPVRGREILAWNDTPANPGTGDEASRQRGAELYRINCALCHGRDGKGPGKVGQKLTPPAPLLDRERLGNLNDGDLFKRISLGFGRMPPFRKWLSATERWDVVNYLRTLH